MHPFSWGRNREGQGAVRSHMGIVQAEVKGKGLEMAWFPRDVVMVGEETFNRAVSWFPCPQKEREEEEQLRHGI